MHVIKRDGSTEPVSFDKVLERIRKAATGLAIDYTRMASLVVGELRDGIRTSELDELAARLAVSYMTTHPDWGTLAAQIIISNCQKSAPPTFSEAMAALTLAPDVAAFIATNAAALDRMIQWPNDFLLDYFGFKTLEKAYLMRSPKGVIMETPQYMWLRVAVGMWGVSDFGLAIPTATRLMRIQETYELMSLKAFTHATPTLFNSGTARAQMSSCFLTGIKEDSLEGIFDTLKDCAQISKYAGGIGLHVSNVRAQGAPIKGTNGTADGLVPMLRVFNNTARYVNQGGRRNGSIAIYLEPWHADTPAFLKMKSNTGSEEEKARDLFYALWIPDLFMRRVKAGAEWSLFCPHDAPGLADVVGAEFDALYTRYEAEGRAKKTMPAQKLWTDMLVSQIETGTPYMLYKDAANQKSNQKNLGVIKSSNLCTEIIEYSSPEETAVCNLASIALPYFIETRPDGSKAFNQDKLRAITSVVVRNLNRVIDINYYPTPETRVSNMRHRPIGIGVQGLADIFALLGLAWESPEAADLNQEIFENIYYAALEESVVQACIDGPYETFKGSPASMGLLQPDLWESFHAQSQTAMKATEMKIKYKAPYLDWASLRERVKRDGLRNSLLLAPMPTASTSQILGYNECIEPFTTNIYARRTLAGEFTVVNRYLVADLMAAGLWTPDLKERMIAANGSIQAIPGIPEPLKQRYKTVWEIKQKTLIDMAAARGAFICQSQSLNLFVAEPTIAKLSSMHFYSWELGLKTGLYYLRTKSAVQAIKFTVDPTATKETKAPEECLLCSA
jgi:ribonucleoside-diphosphate reductase alpha chain